MNDFERFLAERRLLSKKMYNFASEIKHKRKMTMKTNTKRTYEKPQMRVYELRLRPQLLQASKPDYLPEEW